MTLSQILSEKIMPRMKLTPTGEVVRPKDGRIAHNLVIPTQERGEVLFRCYPVNSSKEALGYGIERAKLELKVLTFLSDRGAPVPKPIAVEGAPVQSVEVDGWFVFAYPLEPGRTLDQTDLTTSFAEQAGELLLQILRVAEQYSPEGNEPDGDLDYIKKIMGNFLRRRPDMESNPIFSEMADFLATPGLKKGLLTTPQGLVHGDFFFENVIARDDQLVGVIDFGDVYYGHPVMDVVIGAMEFSMKEGEEWDFDFFEKFLNKTGLWLREHEISFELFYELLLANCIRFTAHLCNLAQDELEENASPKGEIDLSSNPYIERFRRFQEQGMKNEIASRYKKALGRDR